MREMSGNVRVLKKHRGGKSTYLVFEVFPPMRMCISSTNRAKWLESRVIPFSTAFLDSKTNAPLYTKSM